MYNISFTNQFKKDIKRCQKRNYDFSLIENVFEILKGKGELPSNYKPHKLSGNYSNYWECHIKSDWLMIWLQDDMNNEIILERTGTHSDLF